ncbi:MAG: hypothetical protein J5J06_11665 [Phycisphaerae bacterium]|nr:hypothetical protein [Phycisphaerae bacterium]
MPARSHFATILLLVAVAGIPCISGCAVKHRTCCMTCPKNAPCDDLDPAGSRGATVALVPAQPPNGEYPPGTIVRGNEIVLRRKNLRGRVTVYFDIVVRDWGTKHADAGRDGGRVVSVAFSETGSCLYLRAETRKVDCEEQVSAERCKGMRCSVFRKGGSCGDPIWGSLESLDCLNIARLGGIFDAPPPESVCNSASPVAMELVGGQVSCAQFGGSVFSESGPDAVLDKPCETSLQFSAGDAEPLSDRGQAACLATLAVTIPVDQIIPVPGQSISFRINLVGPGLRRGTLPLLQDETGRMINVDGSGAAFVMVD